MKKDDLEKTRARVISMIERDFASDAAFERAASLPKKTVNNWRRGLSSSFMKMLPTLADLFGIAAQELIDTEGRVRHAVLTDDEEKLLSLYRSTEGLSRKTRSELLLAFENMTTLSLSANDDKRVKKPLDK